LEWKHVFILRANANSFPVTYREPLFEFPNALRDAESVAEAEGRELHEQEERRLFYVAMTRARDGLAIYARRGRGKDAAPDGFLRPLLKDPSLGRWLRQRPARGFQTDMFGEATAVAGATRMSGWLALPPATDLGSRLSASAVQSYETCPLQFKLEREWRIPSDVPGAMQYGAAMHHVLRAYFDAVRFKREMSDGTLLHLFRDTLAEAKIQDPYQHELYEKQGVEQLTEFLLLRRRAEPAEVLHTEEWFEVRFGATTVTGRIDRIDRTCDGRIVITDYKSGRAKTQDDAEKSLQLAIYALAARERWGYEADRLVFYNLGENSEVSTRPTEAALAKARLQVQEAAANIAAGKFEPKPGFHCSFCAYRNLCPATEKPAYKLPEKSRAKT
jgi:RecB family exonuclease